MSTTTTRINKLGIVCIPVADQDKALEFYVDTLGFEKRADVPFGNGYRWVEVAPPGAVTTIALAPPPQGTPTGNAQTGIALHTDDIDAVHADLKARGAARVAVLRGRARARAGELLPRAVRRERYARTHHHAA